MEDCLFWGNVFSESAFSVAMNELSPLIEDYKLFS